MGINEEDRIRMGKIDPLLVKEIETSGQRKHKASGDINDRRKARAAHLAKLRSLYLISGPIPDQVTETDYSVSAQDGFSIPIRIYTPRKSLQRPSPLILMLHEGAWVLGDLSDMDMECRMLTRDLGAVCINIDYRLAPEHPWPTCVYDCWDVLQWAAKTASPADTLLPADPEVGFIVGGASAGGNISAVLAQLSRDHSLQPPLTGQYLAVPALLWSDVVPDKWEHEYRSRSECLNDPLMGDHLALNPPNIAGPGSSNPLLSPLLHPNLSNVPPAYFQVCGLDPLRDESLIYERILREENGVRTRIDIYDGYGHCFWNEWPALERSREFHNDTIAGMRWLLESSNGR